MDLINLSTEWAKAEVFSTRFLCYLQFYSLLLLYAFGYLEKLI